MAPVRPSDLASEDAVEEGLFGLAAELEHAISMWTDLPMTDSEGDVDSVKNTSSWSRS